MNSLIGPIIVILLSAIQPVIASPNPKITARAVLPRQIQTEIVGYFQLTGGGWGSYWCNTGYRYCTSSNLGACGTILDTTCNVPRSCASTSFIVDSHGSSILCNGGTNTVCATNYVFQSPGDTSPITSIVCRPSGIPDITLYRSFPQAGILSSGAVVNSATPLASLTSAIVSSTSSPSSSSSAAASATPTPTPNPSPKSMAWVAGPVIGGVAVLAGIIFGAIILRRRRSPTPPPTQRQEEKPRESYYDQKAAHAVIQPEQQQYYPQSPVHAQSPVPYGHAELDAATAARGGAAELGPRY